MVAGTTTSAGGERDLIVRAYDAASGDLLWERTRLATSPVKIIAIGGRVFVAGSSGGHSYLGAFNARTGADLWEDGLPLPGLFRDLALHGERIVAAGSSLNGVFVRAYDTVSGAMEWQDLTTPAPGFDSAAAVVLNDNVVYVAGNSGRDFDYTEVLVRAYDASAGNLLWDDRSHRGSGSSTAVGLALGPRRLFVAGYTAGDFLMRAYDARLTVAATPLTSVPDETRRRRNSPPSDGLHLNGSPMRRPTTMRHKRQIIVHIATSADGYIARPDGDLEWLTTRPRPKGFYGMTAFMRTDRHEDLGRKTYRREPRDGGEVSTAKTSIIVFSRHAPPGRPVRRGVREPGRSAHS